VRRGIDDDLGLERAHGVGEPRRTREVGVVIRAVEVECDEFAQRRERTLKFPADLAALAEQQDLHRAA
jgi:hypothetical protein